MALALLVFVGHACVLPAAAHGEREEAGLQSGPQRGNEPESPPHVSSCEASGVRSAPLTMGQAPVPARDAVPPALGATALGAVRSRAAADPHVLLHPPLRI
jgi:hypothetical protein